MPLSPAFRPARTHADLGGEFFDVVEPARFPAHLLRHRDQRWAARIGLDGLTDAEWIAHFGRFEPLPGSFEAPLALRYHGHQFRHYNPDLGDGRGFLFAQMHDLDDHRLLDLGTKGSGQTPWSRTADGRLTLKGGVREILATTMLEALGVETSKSLSLIETGEPLHRNDEPSPTRSSVLVRLSHSHIRIGTFQRLAYLGDAAALSALLGHAVRHYLPEAAAAAEAEPERAARFFATVCRRVARMGAQWMAAGFVHGVLNTDNINITGESFDYGPWRFLPRYDPAFTAAYFDHGGLYAFGRQPETLLWNLARLGGCLLPLAAETDLKARLEESLHGFGALVQAEFAQAVLWRLGLKPIAPERDSALAGSFFTALLESEAPFEQAFFDARAGRDTPHEAFAPFQAERAAYQRTAPSHPYFDGAAPCTLLVEEVEALWTPIAEADDWRPFHEKLAAIELVRLAHGG